MIQRSFSRGRGAPWILALACLIAVPALALHEEPFGPTEPIRGRPLDIPSKAEAGLTVRLDRIPGRAALVIPLPEGGRMIVVRNGITHRPGGDFVWQGTPQAGGGDVVLTARASVLAGAISTAEGNYLIREAPNGQVRILMVDEGALPIEIGAFVPAGETGGEGGTVEPGAAADGNTVVDTLIVYSPQARSAAGGSAQIEAAIQNAVDWTNVAYANSQMAVEQRLVHTQEVAFDEATECFTCSDTGNACSDSAQCPNGTCRRDMGCDLVWLRNEAAGNDYDGDGQTVVDDLRDGHGADLVALITQNGDYCGIGYVMTSVSAGFAPYAMSVTRRSCLPSTHAHETGHNLGCMHDPANSSYAGAHDYSFGHRYCMSGGFRTVMSYSCSGASRVAHFSNPSVDYDNGAGALPTGQWEADCSPGCAGNSCAGPCRDCAMSITQTAPTAAAFRASAQPTCGDGAINQSAEECDGSDFGGATCQSRGFDGGQLACTGSCTIDDSVCTVCGDGVVDAGEACDGGDLAGATCGDQGCTGGTPTCAADCSVIDYGTCTGCPTCGDGVVNQATEECDGSDLGGASCAAHGCAAGQVSCTTTCTVDYGACALCCGDGLCEAGEDCTSCAADCVGGTVAACGNGVCEAGDGEDCVSCPADCRGKQHGKPSGRYCCGDGDGEAPLACSDPACTTSGWQCSDVAAGSYCCGDASCTGPEDGFSCEQDCGPAPFCGDGTCNGTETPCSCATDCGAPPAGEGVCSDGVDDDCDGATDCADADCDVDAACLCVPRGGACASSDECCTGRCKSRRGTKTCS